MLGSGAGGAEMLHLEPDHHKSEVSATVDEPFGLLRDNPTATGKFEIIDGEIDGDPQNLAGTAHVKIVINATTYDSGDNARDRSVIHSALETWKYQTIVFESSHLEDINVEVPGASGNATVVGHLTLHGVTRTMRVPVRVSMDTDGEFSAGGEVTFDYTEFGISPPRYLFVWPAAKQVTVSFRIVAQRPGSKTPSSQSEQHQVQANRGLAIR
jgi:polyisoprenoid-binding protein YceI